MKLQTVLLCLLGLAATQSLAQDRILGINRNFNLQSGGIFQSTTDGDQAEITHYFAEPPYQSQGRLLKHSNGRIYGVTALGGNRSRGVIYSFREDGSEWTIEHHFEGSDPEGSYPVGGLTEGDYGNIFGILGRGSYLSRRLMYRFNPSDRSFSILHQFRKKEAGTGATLLKGPDGWLYGSSPGGGQENRGSIFRITQDGDSLEVLHEFSNSGAYSPSPYLLFHPNGMIYGYCTNGPGSGYRDTGTLFRLDQATGLLEFLYSFSSQVSPLGSLLADPSGNLYGVTREGGSYSQGMIFKTDSLGDRFVRLYSFGGQDDQVEGASELVWGPGGLLYGYCAGLAGETGRLYRVNTYGDQLAWLADYQPLESHLTNPTLLHTSKGISGYHRDPRQNRLGNRP